MTAAPTPSRCLCTIVIPCYNEAHRLRVRPFLDFLASESLVPGRRTNLLFVNDGSTDGTLLLLEAMRQRAIDEALQGRIAILDRQPNGGKAEAIRVGMLAALGADDGCEYTGFWDADLATPLSAIPQLLTRLEASPHLQMIFGSRVRLLGRHIHRNPARHYLGRIFATAASHTLSLPIYDTQCGAKIFKATPDLARVLAEPFLTRWIFDVEIVARYLQLRGREFCFSSIYEFPLEAWEDVGGSKLRPFDFFYAAFDILRIHRRYLAPNSSRPT